jgi:hypothetical protein
MTTERPLDDRIRSWLLETAPANSRTASSTRPSSERGRCPRRPGSAPGGHLP